MTRNYINNPDFLKALIEHKKMREEAIENGKKEPRISNYIGECFMKIAERLARKPNFSSYTFKDEMIGYAIENCMIAYKNFNPDKYQNPFAYFTRVIAWAFIRKIKLEKRQLYIKYKAIQQFGILDYEMLSSSDDENKLVQFDTYENISEYIDKYEQSMEKKKDKKPKGVEKFLSNDTSEEVESDFIDNLVDELEKEVE